MEGRERGRGQHREDKGGVESGCESERRTEKRVEIVERSISLLTNSDSTIRTSRTSIWMPCEVVRAVEQARSQRRMREKRENGRSERAREAILTARLLEEATFQSSERLRSVSEKLGRWVGAKRSIRFSPSFQPLRVSTSTSDTLRASSSTSNTLQDSQKPRLRVSIVSFNLSKSGHPLLLPIFPRSR